MNHSPTEINSFSIDSHKHLIQVPLLIGIISELLGTPFADFGSEYRTKSVPPEPNRFMTHIDAALVQQVRYIAKLEWKPDVYHHCRADDLKTGLKHLNGLGLVIARR